MLLDVQEGELVTFTRWRVAPNEAIEATMNSPRGARYLALGTLESPRLISLMPCGALDFHHDVLLYGGLSMLPWSVHASSSGETQSRSFALSKTCEVESHNCQRL
jgi:hypothetical protein